MLNCSLSLHCFKTQTRKKLNKYYLVYASFWIIPCVSVLVFYMIGNIPTAYNVSRQHLSYNRITVNNCIVLITIVVGGKINKLVSWMVFIYNSILFGILFSMSADMYGIDYAIVHSFIHGPVEVLGLTIGLIVGCEECSKKRFLSLLGLAIVLILLAAMLEVYAQTI